MQRKLPVSLVIISLNEEHNIERCIRSVPWVSDIVVIDSGSMDHTVAKAQNLGARVFQEKWKGFGPQKRKGNELAFNDWIISLDADEALSPELSLEIQELFAGGPLSPKAYRIPRRSFYLGRWIDHGGWYPDYQTRLFNRKVANWSADPVHEKVIFENPETLKNPLHHWVFKNISHQVITNDKYSWLGTQALIEKGSQFSLGKLLIKPLGKFIECYFIKRGFLDGLPGFLIAISAAYSMFLKFAKLWEYEQQQMTAPDSQKTSQIETK